MSLIKYVFQIYLFKINTNNNLKLTGRFRMQGYSVYNETLKKKSQILEYGAEIAQLGERQTEDLKVPGSIPGFGTFFVSLV